MSTILLLSNILETSDLLVMLNLLPQSLIATEKQERKSGKMVVFEKKWGKDRKFGKNVLIKKFII